MTRKESSSHFINSHSDLYQESIEVVRNQLVNAAIFAIAIVGFPTFVAGLFRTVDVGWQNVMVLHFCTYLAVVVTAILHRRLSFSLRACIVLGGLFLSGIGGLLTWGLIGLGIFFFVTCSVLTTLFFGDRAGLIVLAVSLAVIGVIGVGIHLGRISFDFDIAVYAVAPSSWITTIFSIGFFTGIILTSLGRFHNALTASIRALLQTQEALQESEQRYRLLIENIPTAVWMTGQDGKTIFISSNVEKVYGYSSEEIVEKGEELWLGRIHSDDKEHVKEAFGLLFSQQKRFDIEYRIQRKDGQWIWLHDRANIVEEKEGQLYAYGVFSDITERKKTEVALRTSEEKYRTLFETANDAIFVLKDEKFVDCNKKTLEVFDGTVEQIVGCTPYDLSPPTQPDGRSSKEKALEKINAVLSGGPQFFEWTHSKCGGTLFSTEVSLTCFKMGKEYYVLAIVRDITERKRTEEELQKHREHLEELVEARTAELEQEIAERKRVEDALRKSEGKYRLLAENSTDVIWILDNEDKFSYISPSILQLRGYTPEEAMQQSLEQTITPESLARVQVLRKKRKENDESVFKAEVEQPCKDGSTIWVEAISRPLWDEHGHKIGVLGTSRDITERKRAEEALKKAKDVAEEAQRAAESANRAKSTFLSNMSHELRTPLNAVLGFSQLMERDPTLTSKHREYLGIINRSGDHLLGLINDVLELSKIEAGRSSLVTNSFDLYQTLESLEAMMRIRAEKKGLDLIFEQTPDVPQYIKTDERKLRQILINLLGNAIKFTEEGSVTLRIAKCESRNKPTPHPSQEGKSEIRNLKFEISDTGPGIAPEEMDTVFGAFTQTEHGRKTQEGTGLGLALSRQFAQLMGGDITVTNQVEQGATFTLTIQVELTEASDIQIHQPTRRVIGLEPDQCAADGGLYRILVVDDHHEGRSLLRALLEQVGFAVREATNGQEAIEQYERWQPHLIWMDMRMPVMNGYEATKQIRKLETRNSKLETRIIALTASSFDKDRIAILSAGCDDFLSKPFRDADIFEMMHKHLGVRYVYEEGERLKVKGERLKGKEVLTPEVLALLPLGLLAQLEQATDRGDIRKMLAIIDEIRAHDAAVADALTSLANNFDYDRILRLIQEAKELKIED